MKRFMLSLGLGIALLATMNLVGCDREISHSKEVEMKDNGTVKSREKTVVEHPDGSTTVTEEKSTSKP